MSMLAEQKRKQKFGPDPRNTFWSSDETKFGFRMLENMGWKKGKGLGAKESGMTEHLKAKHRTNDDVRGLGCSKKHAENWIAHQDDFNSILASLNNSSDKADAGSKLPESASASHAMEEKSKSSRSRVHYHKFIRSKDLSSRSSDDLNCIFGRRKGQSSENSAPTAQSEANGDESSSSDDQSNNSSNNNNVVAKDVHSHGVNTIISSSSVQEYFAMKMAELKRKREGGAVNTSYDNGDKSADTSTESSSNKALESADDPLNDSQSVSDVADVGASEDSERVEKKKRKKKKKKNRQEDQENRVECENLSADEVLAPGDSCTDSSPELNSACTEQQSSKSKKKKEKRKKKTGSSECGVDSTSQLSSAEEPGSEPKAKKAKKQSAKLGLLTSEQEETCEILHQNGIGEERTDEPKKKKKKKQKKKEKDTEVESHNSSILRQKSDGKTSRRKSVRFSTGDVEIFLIPNKEDEKAEQEKEGALNKKSKKRKKRKAKSEEETETSMSEGEASSLPTESVQGETDDPQTLKEDDDVPKKKKRKTEKEASSPTTESAQGEVDDQQAMKQDYVPKKKKQKTKKEASSSIESAQEKVDPQTLNEDDDVPKKKKRKTEKEASSPTTERAQGETDDPQALKDDDVPQKKKGKTEEGGKEARKKKSKAQKENLETHQGQSADSEPSHVVLAGNSDGSVNATEREEFECPVSVTTPWVRRARPKKEEITPELIDRICNYFKGSNLRDIKGYTYYANLYANQHH